MRQKSATHFSGVVSELRSGVVCAISALKLPRKKAICWDEGDDDVEMTSWVCDTLDEMQLQVSKSAKADILFLISTTGWALSFRFLPPHPFIPF